MTAVAAVRRRRLVVCSAAGGYVVAASASGQHAARASRAGRAGRATTSPPSRPGRTSSSATPRSGDGYGQVALVPLADPGGPRAFTAGRLRPGVRHPAPRRLPVGRARHRHHLRGAAARRATGADRGPAADRAAQPGPAVPRRHAGRPPRPSSSATPMPTRASSPPVPSSAGADGDGRGDLEKFRAHRRRPGDHRRRPQLLGRHLRRRRHASTPPRPPAGTTWLVRGQPRRRAR